jgi:hypothetical protein
MMAADRIPCGFQENPTKLLADFVPTVIAEPRELFSEKSAKRDRRRITLENRNRKLIIECADMARELGKTQVNCAMQLP